MPSLPYINSYRDFETGTLGTFTKKSGPCGPSASWAKGTASDRFQVINGAG
jgi:hypothetical protein